MVKDDDGTRYNVPGRVSSLSILKCSHGLEVYGISYGVPSQLCRLRNKCVHQRRCQPPSDVHPDRPTGPQWRHYEHYPVENIAFSGGGSKGYAFVGSIKALDDCGILGRVRRVAGSSVGAICAGLVAVGCTPQEIADVFALDVKWLFHDQQCHMFACLPNLVRRFGVHPARRFYDIYGGHIERKLGDADLTFKQLYEQTGRELVVAVTNLTLMVSEYCNYKTTPDLPIRLAVRMSMSFPVLYQPVQHSLGNSTECLYMDGGTLDQYPVHVFDERGPFDIDESDLDINHNINAEVNKKTLGLYVISECPIDYKIWRTIFGIEIPYRPRYVPDTKLAQARLKGEHPCVKQKKKMKKERKRSDSRGKLRQSIRQITASIESLFKWPEGSDEVKIKTFTDYMLATIETLLMHQRRLTVKPGDKDRTVPINCGYVGTNDYGIEVADREFLIRQGYECTRQYLVDYIKRQEREQQDERVRANSSSSGNIPNQLIIRRRIQSCVSIETEV